MMKTMDFVEQLRIKLGAPGEPVSYYRVTKTLGISHTTMQSYKNHKTAFADHVALKAAELLECEPALVLFCMSAERAQTPIARGEMEKFMDAIRPALLEGKVALLGPKTPSPRCILW